MKSYSGHKRHIKWIVTGLLLVLILLLIIFRDQWSAWIMEYMRPIYSSGFQDIVP